MKKTTVKYDRETAIGFLNDFYDKIGVEEENRIDSNMNDAEKAKLASLKASGATEQEIADFTERCDVDREKIITAIRKEKITFDENGEIIQKLDSPICIDGSVVCDELKYSSKQYTVREIDLSMRGVKEETSIQRFIRMIHLRTGVMRTHLEQMKQRDADLANLIEMLFMMPDLPLK